MRLVRIMRKPEEAEGLIMKVWVSDGGRTHKEEEEEEEDKSPKPKDRAIILRPQPKHKEKKR